MPLGSVTIPRNALKGSARASTHFQVHFNSVEIRDCPLVEGQFLDLLFHFVFVLSRNFGML